MWDVSIRRVLLTVLVALSVPAPAHARIVSVVPAGQDGSANDAFFTNEVLYATVVNDSFGGLAQLCVVPAGVTSGECEEDGIWGRPNVVGTHGTFPALPIVAPYLPEGQWAILADNSEDPADDVISVQFTVTACPPGDACSTEIAQAQMQQWKDTAREARTGMAAACVSSTVYAGEGKTMAGSALLNGGARGAIVAELKGVGAGIDGLSFGPRQTQSAAVALLRSVSCGAYLMYDDIVADPPDPDYKHLEEAKPQVPTFGPGEDASVIAAVQTLEETRAQGLAHRIGVERYQGAVLAGDKGWAAVQADQIGDQALETQSQMRRLGRRLRNAAVSVSGLGLTAATPTDLDTVEAIRERVRVNGFTSEERAELEGEGLTADEIAQVRSQIGAPLPAGVAPMAPDAALQLSADHVDNATCVDETDLCGFDEMGRHAGAVGANGRIPPTVTVTPLEIREGNHGVNHGRVRIELSHPSTTMVGGTLELTPATTAEGEVVVPDSSWFLDRGRTRTYRSVATAADTIDEPTETASLTASAPAAAIEPSAPAVISILDDDGTGDPPTRPRAERGIVAMLGATTGSGSRLHLSEPDGTELTSLGEDTYASQWLADWSPDGRWMLLQDIAPTASAYASGGEPVRIQRVGQDGELVGALREVIPGLPNPAVQPSFSRDGTRLLMAQSRDGGYKLAVAPFDRQAGTVVAAHVTGDDPPLENWWSGHGATFSPDRSRIAFAGCSPGFARCGIFVVPVGDSGAATGPPVALRELPANRVWWPSWSPDGRFIAHTELDDDGRLGIRTQRVGADGAPLAAPRWVLRDSVYWIPTRPTWSPDSRSFVVGMPTDPMLAENEGGSALVFDLDADGARVGAPVQLGLTGSVPQPVWGVLPDDTAPVTALEATPAPGADGVHREAVSVKLTATDNRRVARLDYSIDGAQQSAGADSATFRFDRSGTYVVRYRATDAAGNEEAEQERTIRVALPEPAVVQPQQPAQEPPPTTSTPPVVKPAPVATLPSNRRCVSRRKFRIRLRTTKDDPLVRAVVFLNRKRVRVVRGARLTAAIDLRGLPRGRVTVRVVGTTRSGRKETSKRTYRTCVPKRRR